jgi:aspartyl/glutamyl-tRNA(Asn/Gln) amidotransferase C subunit
MKDQAQQEDISRETFDHIVRLAALELAPEEAEYLRKQLNNQLKAVRELENIPLEAGAPLTIHGVPYTAEIRPPIRPDEWIPFPDPEKILEQAPETEDGYIVVPDIPHEELE